MFGKFAKWLINNSALVVTDVLAYFNGLYSVDCFWWKMVDQYIV